MEDGPPSALTPADVEIKPEALSSFVEQMKARAKQRAEEAEDD